MPTIKADVGKPAAPGSLPWAYQQLQEGHAIVSNTVRQMRPGNSYLIMPGSRRVYAVSNWGERTPFTPTQAEVFARDYRVTRDV